MESIPDTMRTISRDIQNTFEELMKLLLRKTLRPVLNPLKLNKKIVYNSFKKRYERGFIGASPEDNVNKYSYLMTHDCLGWTDDSLTNFRVLAKFIKNNVAQRFPSGHAKIRNELLSKSKISFSEKESKASSSMSRLPVIQYKSFLSFLTSKTMQNVIINKKAFFSYSADVPYGHAFKQLESIGKDIIEQTDNSISGSDSAKMSTSMLRVKLYNLETRLGELSVNHCNIFESYLGMLRVINSVQRAKMVWVINLIATLSFQSWSDLTEEQQNCYINALGEDFMKNFNANELITILLQGNASEVILTSCYLYSLLKMLFCVFGYSRLVPIVSNNYPQEMRESCENKLRKHLEKYRGATLRRREDENNAETEASEIKSESKRPEAEPLDPCIYDFIKLFGDLYPTLIGLMGGTEVFPPENIEIECGSIPANYQDLNTVPEFLWRYNDFSYCIYLEYIGSKQLQSSLSSKVNAKAKYLQTV